MRHLRPAGRRQGAIMVLTIWLIVVLMVMAYSLSYEMRLGLKSTAFAQRRIKAEGLARLGIAKAVVDLRNDRLLAFNNPNNFNDTLEDIWARDEDEHIDVKEGENAAYSYIVRDEDRKLDLNMITQQNMDALVYLLKDLYKIPPKEAEGMALALIDYKDSDLKPLTGKGATEAEAYTDWGLDHFGRDLPGNWSFKPKNDDLQNINELLLMPGFTRELLFGDPEEQPRDPFEREQERGRQRRGGPLSDYVTVGTGHGVNYNTADETVLTAMLVGAKVSPGEAPGIADKIIDLRKSRQKMKQNGVAGLTNVAQLQEAGISQQIVTALGTVAPPVFISYVYTITARGEYQGVRQTLQARVSTSIESYQIDTKKEGRHRQRDERGLGMIKNKPDLRVDPAVRVVWMSTPTE